MISVNWNGIKLKFSNWLPNRWLKDYNRENDNENIDGNIYILHILYHTHANNIIRDIHNIIIMRKLILKNPAKYTK